MAWLTLFAPVLLGLLQQCNAKKSAPLAARQTLMLPENRDPETGMFTEAAICPGRHKARVCLRRAHKADHTQPLQLSRNVLNAEVVRQYQAIVDATDEEAVAMCAMHTPDESED